MQVTKGNL